MSQNNNNNNHQKAFLLIDDEVYFITKEETNIGRNQYNDVVIHDMRVSRSHARILFLNNRYLLIDLNSSGGTFVNDRPIVQKLLEEGDVISLASSSAFIFQADASMLPEDYPIYNPLPDTESSRRQTTTAKPVSKKEVEAAEE